MTDETTTEQLAEIDKDMADIERQVAELVEEAQQADYPQPEPEPQLEPIQVREGQWRTRNGEVKNIRPCEPLRGAYFVWPWTDGFMTFQDNGRHQGSQESPNDLVEYLGPIEEQPEPQPETTSEQLVEIEGQGESTPATEYTPPEGWRVLAVGELLQEGDQIVQLHDGKRFPTERAGQYVCETQRYIRRIEPQPEPQPQADPEPQQADTQATEYTPTEHWRVLQVGEPLKGGDEYHAELNRYIRRIEPEPQAQPQQQAVTIEELRSEVYYVQNLLGESRQRVRQLEELVSSLRIINETQEKAFTAAGKENTALRNQLAAVKAELANVAADRQQLRVELDAAQQVPADSPELRQLRLDLAEVTQDRDTYRDGYDRVLSDLRTIRETTAADTVETIAEWLEPIKGAIDAADNQDELARAGFFAIDTIRHLPAIMRTLTGLTPED